MEYPTRDWVLTAPIPIHSNAHSSVPLSESRCSGWPKRAGKERTRDTPCTGFVFTPHYPQWLHLGNNGNGRVAPNPTGNPFPLLRSGSMYEIDFSLRFMPPHPAPHGNPRNGEDDLGEGSRENSGMAGEKRTIIAPGSPLPFSKGSNHTRRCGGHSKMGPPPAKGMENTKTTLRGGRPLILRNAPPCGGDHRPHVCSSGIRTPAPGAGVLRTQNRGKPLLRGHPLFPGKGPDELPGNIPPRPGHP